ncbi:hypothetical protein BpHYR1_005703 [Brachionus plicatilis]|uniref:Uncharacterized protein n=1 Tax=Brachionus plicatilis TaxID=10195 RepID=A0A3M7QV47_BRAPC|nr:hypothetical protein BpHYR1_005703 [Brachionus plicatilis]
MVSLTKQEFKERERIEITGFEEILNANEDVKWEEDKRKVEKKLETLCVDKTKCKSTVGISKTTCPLRSRPPNRTISGAVPNQQRRRTVP